MNESKFELELADDNKRIVIRPTDVLGRRYKPMSVSIQCAEGLAEALRQLTAEAKIKSYN